MIESILFNQFNLSVKSRVEEKEQWKRNVERKNKRERERVIARVHDIRTVNLNRRAHQIRRIILCTQIKTSNSDVSCAFDDSNRPNN